MTKRLHLDVWPLGYGGRVQPTASATTARSTPVPMRITFALAALVALFVYRHRSKDETVPPEAMSHDPVSPELALVDASLRDRLILEQAVTEGAAPDASPTGAAEPGVDEAAAVGVPSSSLPLSSPWPPQVWVSRSSWRMAKTRPLTLSRRLPPRPHRRPHRDSDPAGVTSHGRRSRELRDTRSRFAEPARSSTRRRRPFHTSGFQSDGSEVDGRSSSPRGPTNGTSGRSRESAWAVGVVAAVVATTFTVR